MIEEELRKRKPTPLKALRAYPMIAKQVQAKLIDQISEIKHNKLCHFIRVKVKEKKHSDDRPNNLA